MKRKNSFPKDNKESQLNETEFNVLRSHLESKDEDRSKIPFPKKEEQNKLIKYAKKNKASTVFISVIAVTLLALLIIISVYLVKNFTGANSKRDYTFIFGDEETKIKYEKIVIDDVLYVDMNRLARYAEIPVSGSEESMKYVLGDDNYLKFFDGADYAIINAVKVSIPFPAKVKNNICLVPYSVISKAVSGGLTFKLDRKKSIVTVTRNTYKVEDMVYFEDITFSNENFKSIQAMKDTQNTEFKYSTDVSAYLPYINPSDNSPFLLLVNPYTPLGDAYVPDNLVKIPRMYTGSGDYYLDSTAKSALVAMMKEMNEEIPGNGAFVISAYRSYEYQHKKFEEYIKEYTDKGYSREDAITEVCKTAAKPGFSEHQSGLCVDFYTNSMSGGLSNEGFESTSAFEWLSQNAYKFGFVLRYPKDKTDITCYHYESWHYRFVGRDVATTMFFSNLCFEEYLEFI